MLYTDVIMIIIINNNNNNNNNIADRPLAGA